MTHAEQAAIGNIARLQKLVGVEKKFSVINVVALQTRGMLSSKMLDQVRAHMLMGELPGHILIVYPLIPAKIFAAKRSTIVSSGTMPGLTGLMPAVGGMSDQNDDESSQEDNFDDEGQLPEVVTKRCTTMTPWERQGALAKD